MPIQDIWPKTMPDLVNTDQGSAEATLNADLIPFSYGASAYSATIVSGNILTQSPTAGSTLNLGDSVTLTVSLGPFGARGLSMVSDFSFRI